MVAHYCKGDHCAEVMFEDRDEGKRISHELNLTCTRGFQLVLTPDMAFPNRTYETKMLCRNISTSRCWSKVQCEYNIINEETGEKFQRDISKLECQNRIWGRKDTIIASTVGGTFLLIIITSCVSYFYLRARANRPPSTATTPPVQQPSKCGE